MIVTQRGNTGHIQTNHKVHLKKAKTFVRGFSSQSHTGTTIMLSYFWITVYHQDESIGIPWRLIKEQIEK